MPRPNYGFICIAIFFTCTHAHLYGWGTNESWTLNPSVIIMVGVFGDKENYWLGVWLAIFQSILHTSTEEASEEGICRVGLYTVQLYAIIPTLFRNPCFCWSTMHLVTLMFISLVQLYVVRRLGTLQPSCAIISYATWIPQVDLNHNTRGVEQAGVPYYPVMGAQNGFNTTSPSFLQRSSRDQELSTANLGSSSGPARCWSFGRSSHEHTVGQPLSSLPTRLASQQVELWHIQKGQRTQTTRLLHLLGNQIKATQAKGLDPRSVIHSLPKSELLLPEMRSSRRFSRNVESVANHSKRSSLRSFWRWETDEHWFRSLLSFQLAFLKATTDRRAPCGCIRSCMYKTIACVYIVTSSGPISGINKFVIT